MKKKKDENDIMEPKYLHFLLPLLGSLLCPLFVL